MELFFQQVLAGLATGAIYACVALAVVMIYQAIGHLNFAQGEMAMFSTFIAWQLIQWGAPYWAAFIITVALSFIGGVIIERVIFRPIHDAPILSHVVVFIGLLTILNSAAGFIWNFLIKQFPTPFGNRSMFGGLLGSHQLGMIIVTLLLLVALYVFFSYTRVGLAMRAAADNPASAQLVGIRVGWMVALGWGMAAAIGAVAGMMIAPLIINGRLVLESLSGLVARRKVPEQVCAGEALTDEVIAENRRRWMSCGLMTVEDWVERVGEAETGDR